MGVAAVFIFSLAVFLFITALMGTLLQRRLQARQRAAELRGDPSETPAERKAERRKTKLEGKIQFAATKKALRRLENELYDIGIQIPVGNFVALWAVAAIVFPLLLLLMGVNGFAPAIIAVVFALAPIIYVSVRRSNRRRKLDAQLTEAITLLCNALRAGHSFQSAMNTIASEMDAPISEEFGRVFRETLRGMSLEESMHRMVDRVGSTDLEILTTAIIIQREIGGNLTEILENISGTIQSRIAMKSEIKTRTSSGRISGYIIGALPVFLLIAMSAVSPDYCQPLFTTDLGKILLLVGLVMELLGFVVIKKITNIKY